MSGESRIRRRRPPGLHIQVTRQLHPPKITVRGDHGEPVPFRNRCDPEVVFPEAEFFDVDAPQFRLFTGAEPGDDRRLQLTVRIGRLVVDRKDLDVVEKTLDDRPVLRRVCRFFGHVDEFTTNHNARGDENIAKGPQFSGDSGVPGKKLAAMVGVEEVHALKRGFAPDGVHFLQQQFGVLSHPGPRVLDERLCGRMARDGLAPCPHPSSARLFS